MTTKTLDELPVGAWYRPLGAGVLCLKVSDTHRYNTLTRTIREHHELATTSLHPQPAPAIIPAPQEKLRNLGLGKRFECDGETYAVVAHCRDCGKVFVQRGRCDVVTKFSDTMEVTPCD